MVGGWTRPILLKTWLYADAISLFKSNNNYQQLWNKKSEPCEHIGYTHVSLELWCSAWMIRNRLPARQQQACNSAARPDSLWGNYLRARTKASSTHNECFCRVSRLQRTLGNPVRICIEYDSFYLRHNLPQAYKPLLCLVPQKGVGLI